MDRQDARRRCACRRGERQKRSEEQKPPQNGALQLVRILSAGLRPTAAAGTLGTPVKIFLAVVVAFLAAPAAAFGEVSLTVRQGPLHGERIPAAAPTARVDMVGLHWRGSRSVDFRPRFLDG